MSDLRLSFPPLQMSRMDTMEEDVEHMETANEDAVNSVERQESGGQNAMQVQIDTLT